MLRTSRGSSKQADQPTEAMQSGGLCSPLSVLWCNCGTALSLAVSPPAHSDERRLPGSQYPVGACRHGIRDAALGKTAAPFRMVPGQSCNVSLRSPLCVFNGSGSMVACWPEMTSLLTSVLLYRQVGKFMKTNTWPVQDAKARFSELLEAAAQRGPQLVTRRGVEAAMLVPIEEWNRIKQNRRATLKELLLLPEARFESGSLLSKRGQHIRKRPLVVFE